MVVRLSTAARNASTAGVVGLIDAGIGPGTIQIRSGAQPATAGTAASGTLLATVTLGDPAFGAPATGTATGADPAPVTGVADGAAGWFRVLDSTGATVFDGSVTVTGGGGDMTVATTTISVGVSVDVTALSYTTPAG